MKKKVLIILSVLFVALVAAAFSGHAWLVGRFKKEALVAEMEAAWNCRAHIESSTVSLFSNPAKVEITGIKLAPSDGESGKPLSARSAFPSDAALVTAETATLTVTLQDLISKRFNIKELHLDTVNVGTVITEDGISSLDVMFKSPKDLAEISTQAAPPLEMHSGSTGNPAPSAPQEDAPKSPKPKDAAKSKAKEEVLKEPFKAQDLSLALVVDKASISNGHIQVKDLGKQTQTVIENLNISLKEIDVDPVNLAKHNLCKLSFEGSIHVEEYAVGKTIAKFSTLGDGVLEPFDPTTGIWKPDLDLNVTVKKGGLMGGEPLEEQLGKKDREKIKEYGIDLDGLAIGGVLQEDLVTRIHAVGSKLIIKQDTVLLFPEYAITLLDTSWVNAPENNHILRGKLTVSTERTQRILSGAEKKLGERYGDSVASLAQATVNATLLDEQKRLNLPFKSRGELSKPKVSLDTAMDSIKDNLKDAGRSLLKGLLGQ